MSALTTGYSAATISYDFDTGEQRRRDESAFYGYIPSDSRENVVFVCMVLNGALLLLLKSVSTALLAKVSVAYVAFFYSGDMLMYLLYRVLRRDLAHWSPVEGVAGAVLTITLRGRNEGHRRFYRNRIV